MNKPHNLNNLKENPIRIRKLSDLVIMPTSQIEEKALNSQFFPQIEKKSEIISANIPRIRKGSFNLCNENETENKKLENLKRKTVINDIMEKKQKI